ncbi:MAG: TetR/AcrR family transcriptional regulator [Actinomycetota bacterium]
MAPRKTADEVIAAAERVLGDDGIDALSVRRLADELGVSRQIVYTHFSGMHEVLEAVHRRAGVQLADAVATLEPPTGSDARIVAGAHAYVDHARRRPSVFALLFGRPVPGYVPSAETAGALRSVFRVHIVGLVDEWSVANGHDLDRHEAVERARVFWSAIHGLVTLEQAGHAEQGETDAMVDSLVGTMLAGWRARG